MEKYGTLTCRSLLKDYTNKEGIIDIKNPERKQHCTDIVTTAVTLAQQIIYHS